MPKIFRLTLPFLILIIILSLLISFIDVVSMIVFSGALSKAFGYHNELQILSVDFVNIEKLSFFMMLMIYLALFFSSFLITWVVTYLSNLIGVKLFKNTQQLIMNGELTTFLQKPISYYQVVLFEEVKALQERFFVSLSVVIHRAIYLLFTILIFIDLFAHQLLEFEISFLTIFFIASVLSSFLLFIYFVTKRLGWFILEKNKSRYQLSSHGFWQWRWIKIQGKANSLLQLSEKLGINISKSNALVTTIGISFKSLLEIFILLLVFVNYDSLNFNNSITEGEVILLGVIIYRMMPTLSAILNNFVNVTSSISSFKFVSEVLGQFETPFFGRDKKDRLNLKSLNSSNYSLQLKNIVFNLKDRNLISNLTYDFPKKGFIVIVGESGSGKSTLINIILGLLKPKSGKVMYKGQLINDSNRSFLWKDVGLVEQDYNNFFGSVREAMSDIDIYKKENLLTLREVFKLKKNAQIESFLNQSIQSLSGGERQRIAFLRVFLLKPKVLILDEFGSGLDKSSLRVFEGFCSEFSKENLVIWASHIDRVGQIADKLIDLNNQN